MGFPTIATWASPLIILDEEALKYIDYDLDVKVLQMVRNASWTSKSMNVHKRKMKLS